MHGMYSAWVSNLFMAKGHTHYCGLVARGKIAVSGIPKCLDYRVIFIVHTQLANVAVDRIIQPGKPALETHGIEHYVYTINIQARHQHDEF
jgi:hypothetical protein